MHNMCLKKSAIRSFVSGFMFCFLFISETGQAKNRQANEGISTPFEIVKGEYLNHPYISSAVNVERNTVLIAYEKQIDAVALPFKSELHVLRMEAGKSDYKEIFIKGNNTHYYYNPQFVKSQRGIELFLNGFDVSKRTSFFEKLILKEGVFSDPIKLQIQDDLKDQLRPWIFARVNSDNTTTLSYEFKHFNEHPPTELERNHLKFAKSFDGIHFDQSIEMGTGVMPRHAEFPTGKKIFTRQNGNLKNMMVYFRLSLEGISWSQEMPISSQTDIHDAFLFQRLDGLIDIYYLVGGGGRGYVVARRSINDKGELGPEIALTQVKQGSFTQPHPARLNDGRILLLITKEIENQTNYSLYGMYLEKDADLSVN